MRKERAFACPGSGCGAGTPLPPRAPATAGSKSTAWLNHLVDAYGLGTDIDGGGISVGLNQNDPLGTPFIEGMSAEDLEALFSDRDNVFLQTGRTEHERWYSNTFGTGGEATIQGEGVDTVQDWTSDTNTLYLDGLSGDADDVNYWGDWLTSEVVGGNTIIHFGSGADAGSITLLGVSTSIDALVADTRVTFGLPEGLLL